MRRFKIVFFQTPFYLCVLHIYHVTRVATLSVRILGGACQVAPPFRWRHCSWTDRVEQLDRTGRRDDASDAFSIGAHLLRSRFKTWGSHRHGARLRNPVPFRLMLLQSAGRWRHLQTSATYFRPHWSTEVGTSDVPTPEVGQKWGRPHLCKIGPWAALGVL